MADLDQDIWWKKAQEDPEAVILDVRTEAEIEDGYIPGAKFLDFYGGAEFVQGIDALDKNKNYYVYCRSGNRSGQACAIMNTRGIEHTHNLVGGMMEWNGEVVED